LRNGAQLPEYAVVPPLIVIPGVWVDVNAGINGVGGLL
jgi:hypothetical protein